ncbi:MAG: oligoendopeptidase F [Bacilli bacterium]|nr:oligoendopeptidase F [Bacilli bacterium]MDD4808630.1 oligoendopeptidase F [Bacilli bacterium]
MAILEKSRDQIDNKYKWDLSLIYQYNEEWEEDFKQITNSITQFKNYKQQKKKLLDDPKQLYELIHLYFEVGRKIEKVYMYAHLNYDADTNNNVYQTLMGRLSNLYKEYDEETIFIVPLLNKTNYQKIKDYYQEVESLKEYDNYFKEVFRYKKHTLSASEEKILSSLNNVLEVPSKTYSLLTDTDLTFDPIKDENGNEVPLTNSNYRTYIVSKDRSVRERTFNSLYKSFNGVINTMASTLYGFVDSNVTMAKMRKHPSAIDMALYGDNVNKSVYNNLVITVSNNLDKLFKYYRLRKDVLGLDELHLYDIYVDLIETKTKEYSFEEGKKLVMKALSLLGDDYSSNLKRAFDEKWIDIYSNKGKRSGAYSSGGYDTKPYILLNYQNQLDDASTLAHELGHSLHSYYSINNNNFSNYQYSIFVAEVASTVNELLLCKYMLKESQDKDEKLAILNKLLELFKGTIFRQTMFAEYEKEIYERCEKGDILTEELLSDLYFELNQKYFGSDVVVDEQIRYEWARIPHFYYNFYVYKYATGLSAACYIVNNLLSGSKDYKEKYLNFLKSGSRDYPIELLKMVDVDMNDPKVVESAINMFDETIDEFIKLYNS